MTKIDLSNIKQKETKNGIYYLWNDSIGSIIPFIKDDIKGELILLKNESGNSCIQTVLYNDKKYNIPNDSLKGNKLSVIFGKKFKIDWAYEIGDVIKDENKFGKVRDITITAREHKKIRKSDTNNHKYYQYKCNICGYDCAMDDTWIEEVNIYRKGSGCSVCAGQKVITGINDIYTTNPEMLDYIIDKNFAATHTFRSSIKTEMKCPVCGFKKILDPSHLYSQGFACQNCSDYISYPERFMMSVLNQNNINYKYQLSKAMFDWCNKYKYDFYLYDYNCIIETHGRQHYEDASEYWFNDRNEIENDNIKRQLAKDNGVLKYIEIDCSESNQNYIYKSIVNSELINIIDLSKTDFKLANKYATSSLIKEICEIYDKKYPNISLSMLSKMYHINKSTIISYLKQGVKAGFCKKYTGKDDRLINSHIAAKPIKILYNGNVYYLRNKIMFKEWLIEHYNKSDYYYFLSKCLDNDIEYRGVKVYSISKEEFNNGFNDTDIISIGEPFLLDIISEYQGIV